MALSVLGPLSVEGPSGAVPVTGRKTREVLAMLALAAPRPLTAAALVDHLWDNPPPSAVKTVQAHVSRVRAALDAARGEAGRLDGGQAGYRLLAGPAQLDVLAVADLRRRARIATLAGHDHDAAGWLGEARQRWRGEPELPATIAGDAERARLAEERLQLTEDQLAAQISAGRPADAVAELQALTARHPLRERLWELLLTALPVRASGRRGRRLSDRPTASARRGRDGTRRCAASPRPGRPLAHAPLDRPYPTHSTSRGALQRASLRRLRRCARRVGRLRHGAPRTCSC